MAENGKLLVICPSTRSPFVLSDVEILREQYETELLGLNMFRFPKKARLLFRFIPRLLDSSLVIVILYFSVPTYAPFAAALTKIFRKRLLIITGGHDITYVPRADWGEMKSFWKRIAQRFTLALADRVLAFSEFSQQNILKYARPKKIQTLQFGIDSNLFHPSGQKEPMVITVCFHVSASTLIQKGLKTFLACAKNIPEASFVLIGRHSKEKEVDRVKRNSSSNVEFIDRFIPLQELIGYYQRAAVYLQVSAYEGFGIANAEAMACECVPVATSGTALPEVVGDTGLIVEFGNIEETTRAIRSALSTPELGKKARKRIQDHFPFSLRRNGLLLAVGSTIKGH